MTVSNLQYLLVQLEVPTQLWCYALVHRLSPDTALQLQDLTAIIDAPQDLIVSLVYLPQ